MSQLQQSLLISGSIFVVVMLSQYGRRAYNVQALARPLLVSGVFGYIYLKGAPTSTVDFVVYGVGAAIGAAFGLVAYLTTKVERDVSGVVETICGAGFVSIWLAAVAVRIIFIALSEHNPTFRAHLGQFMVNHGIVEDAIAPFFVLMALTMLLARLALVAAKVHRLPQVDPRTAELVSA